jgi:hypothetical protein
MTNRIGDRPRFPLQNQRFDKGDAEDIARYYEEIISRFTGSIYGQAWGCLSNPKFEVLTSTLAGPYIKPNKCVLLYSVPEDGTLNTTSTDVGPWEATTVLYDPEKAGQPEQALYLNAFFSATPQLRKRPWILFRRMETATGVGNKAYWDTSSNTEEIGAAPLRQSEYVEFKLSVTYSSNDRAAGWYRMAYIDAWGSPASASNPVIVPVHWIDSQYYTDSTPPTQSIAVGVTMNSPNQPASDGQKGFVPSAEMPELAKVLHWVTGKLAQHYSSTGTLQVASATESVYNTKAGAFVHNFNVPGGWLSTPARGLLELDTDLAAAEEAIVNLNAVDVSIVQAADDFLQKYRSTPRLLHALYVRPVDNGAWTDTTFTVTYDSATVEPIGFSPTLAPYTGGPLAAQMNYQFTPVDGGDGERKIILQLIGTSYMITAVNIVHHISHIGTLSGQSGLSVNQKYDGILPPGTSVGVVFVVEETEGSSATDVVTPFTVYIYGRNV